MRLLSIVLASLLLLITATSSEASLQIVIDNLDPQVSSSGTWGVSSAAPNPWGTNVWYTAGVSGGQQYIQYTPDIPVAGWYQVEAYWPRWDSHRSTDTPFTIQHLGGPTTVDKSQLGTGGEWFDLGTYQFAANATDGYVRIGNDIQSSGNVIADAVRFTHVPEPASLVVWAVLGTAAVLVGSFWRRRRTA